MHTSCNHHHSLMDFFILPRFLSLVNESTLDESRPTSSSVPPHSIMSLAVSDAVPAPRIIAPLTFPVRPAIAVSAPDIAVLYTNLAASPYSSAIFSPRLIEGLSIHNLGNRVLSYITLISQVEFTSFVTWSCKMQRTHTSLKKTDIVLLHYL